MHYRVRFEVGGGGGGGDGGEGRMARDDDNHRQAMHSEAMNTSTNLEVIFLAQHRTWEPPKLVPR